MIRTQDSRRSRCPRRRGSTLMEVMVVSTIMGVLMVIPIPHFTRAIEQSKLDVAFGNLRAIWSAERYYFLENGVYGGIADLAPSPDPQNASLIDPSINAASSHYSYDVVLSANKLSFTASATAKPSPLTRCFGSLTIDQAGKPSSSVTYGALSGPSMTPSLEPNLLEFNP